jgi:hypothetical protein
VCLQGLIKITVMDADMGLRYESIGSYTFDTTYVYFRKDHEVHRMWIALMDDNGADTVSNDFFLPKISMAKH